MPVEVLAGAVVAHGVRGSACRAALYVAQGDAGFEHGGDKGVSQKRHRHKTQNLTGPAPSWMTQLTRARLLVAAVSARQPP